MRIIISGEELEAKGLLEAPKYAVQALQRQTGLTLAELYKKGNDPDNLDREVFTTQVIEFLTEHSRGNRVTWKELEARPVPILLADAMDEAQAQAQEHGKGSEDSEGPTRARTDSPADAAPAAHAPKAKTRKSNGSSKKNRGSKGKSTSGSSTSSTSSPD